MKIQLHLARTTHYKNGYGIWALGFSARDAEERLLNMNLAYEVPFRFEADDGGEDGEMFPGKDRDDREDFVFQQVEIFKQREQQLKKLRDPETGSMLAFPVGLVDIEISDFDGAVSYGGDVKAKRMKYEDGLWRTSDGEA